MERFIAYANYMPSLQHARDWSHEATKNALSAYKMTDIVNYMF